MIGQINTVRQLRGLPAIETLQAPSGSASPLDAAEQATGLHIVGDDHTNKFAFECETSTLARKVATALDERFDESTSTVALPRALEDFVIASSFDLVFIALDGTVRGWIDPADQDPTLWELHLLDAVAYPPGHEPSTTP